MKPRIFSKLCRGGIDRLSGLILGWALSVVATAGFADAPESPAAKPVTYRESDFRRDPRLAAELRDTVVLSLAPVRSGSTLRSHSIPYRLEAGTHAFCLDRDRPWVRLGVFDASGKNLLRLEPGKPERTCKSFEASNPGVYTLRVVHDGARIGRLPQVAFLRPATSQPPPLVDARGNPAGGFWALRPDPAADPQHRLGRLAPASPWQPTGSLNVARANFTATALAGSKVLAAGGDNPPQGSAEIYDPVSAAWSLTGSMREARSFHAATPLNGKVLATGGQTPAGVTATAELYDPAAGAWSTRASMNHARMNHAAVELTSGLILASGGLDGAASLNSAELYDPAADRWTETCAMLAPRFGHTLTLLPSGKVLAVGQNVQNPNQPAAELYDPATGKWTATGFMAVGRYAHTATLLPSGRVLVAGGRVETAAKTQSCTASVEQFDPASGTWSSAGSGPLAIARAYHTATLLPSGGLVVAGGDANCDSSDYSPIAQDEIRDPDGYAWLPFGAAAEARAFHQTVFLPISAPGYGRGPLLDIGGSGAGMLPLRASERAVAYAPLAADYANEALTPFGLVNVANPHRPTALSGGELDTGQGVDRYYSLRAHFLRKESSNWFEKLPLKVTDLGSYRAQLGEKPFIGGKKPDPVFLHEDAYSPASLYFDDAAWPSGNPPLAFDVLFRFYPDGGMIGELKAGEAAIFQQCDYQGQAAVFALDTPSLAALNHPMLNLDKSAASVKLGPDTGVRLYAGANFSGDNLLIGGDTPCLNSTPIGQGTASSLQVVALTPPVIVSAGSCEFCQLQGLDLSRQSLAGADLSYADLTASRLDGANLTQTQLDNATLNAAAGDAAIFTGSDLYFASLRNSSFRQSRFYGASLIKADLEGADLGGAFFTNCDTAQCSPPIKSAAYLDQAHLKNVNLAKANLSGASLVNASFYSGSPVGGAGCDFANLKNCASAAGAVFNSADFGSAYLAGVDFTQANLQGAKFDGAILIAANLNGGSFTADPSTGVAASLTYAYLQGAQMGQAAMSGASLEGAYLDFRSQGNMMSIKLPEKYGAFRNWHAPGSPICVMIAYADPTAVCPPGGNGPCPGKDPTLICPNGQSNLAGGCGPADPGGSNPNWNGGGAPAEPAASYWFDATYTAKTAQVCPTPDFAW